MQSPLIADGQKTTGYSKTVVACTAVVAICGLTALATSSAPASQSLYVATSNVQGAVATRGVARGQSALGASHDSTKTFMSAEVMPARRSQTEFRRPQQAFRTEAEAPTASMMTFAAPFLAAITGLSYFLGRAQAQSQAPQLALAGAGAGASEHKIQMDLPTFFQMSESSGSTATATPSGGSNPDGPEMPEPTPGDDGAFAGYTPSQLEELYVDALWAYYKDGKAQMTDEEFDQLKTELNWQGSGFPALRRTEVEFVEAVLAYYRGEPIITDDEYDTLKGEVQKDGKRKEVTSFLLSIKGKKELSPEEYERLTREMSEAGVSPSPTGYECTLSETSNSLQYQAQEVLLMYSALGLVPSAITSTAFGLLAFIVGGFPAVGSMATTGFPIVGGTSFLITRQMVRYLDLTGPKLVKGTCPCCTKEITASFFDVTPKSKPEKCPNCKTVVTFDSESMMIKDVGGLTFVGDAAGKKSVDEYLSWASGVASGILVGSNEVSKLGGRKATGGKKPKPTTVAEMTKEEIKAGIFAWAVLLGYGIFGETFTGRVRGKGIAIHSGVINDFCARFNIPNGLRQKYIQTAKRNGHDLGFLVDGAGTIGDGLFGKQAMKWWKEQGF